MGRCQSLWLDFLHMINVAVGIVVVEVDDYALVVADGKTIKQAHHRIREVTHHRIRTRRAIVATLRITLRVSALAH